MTIEPFKDTLVKPEVKLSEPGDHDRFSHIVFPASKLTEAYINGTAVVALCGHTWVPTRDPKKFPVCGTCKDVYNKMHDDNTRNWDSGT